MMKFNLFEFLNLPLENSFDLVYDSSGVGEICI